MQKFSFEEDPYNEKVLGRNPLHFGKVKLNQNEKVLTHNFSKRIYLRSIKIHKKLDKGHSTKKNQHLHLVDQCKDMKMNITTFLEILLKKG